MKNGRFLYGLSLVLIFCLLAFPLGCGSAGGSGNIDDPTGEETATAEGGAEGIEGEEAPEEVGAAAGIKFVSAEPSIIAIKGSGGDQISEIKFMVIDTYDNPLQGENVSFGLVGPTGATIDPTSAVTDADGMATVRLYSGSVAGPVTVSATIDLPMTVQSTAVSIGGGVPSDARFSVAATKLNLPGLVWNGKETEISAWLADRFGSYNILEGTSVSFGTEVGLATATAGVTLGDDGVATVTVRTQAGAGWSHGEDVLPEPWETDLQTYLASTYGYTGTTAHPRDGLVSVLVYTKGEEKFDDADSDGVYDAGEFKPAYDTAEDPFYDYNDNDTYDGPASLDPEEVYIDSAANGVWNGGDGAWSANTHIFRNFKILVTGKPVNVAVNPYPVVVPASDCTQVRILVADANFNQLVAGSSVDVSSNVGNLSGLTNREYADSNQVGPDLANHLALIEYDLDLCHDGTAGEGQITLQISWTPEGETAESWTYYIPVTLQ
jgi:hypothetical protein